MSRMMRQRSKTTPRVKNGRVQRKNYRDVDFRRRGLEIQVDAPAAGRRHAVTPELLERFVQIIPNWAKISRGLELIILGPGNTGYDGYYEDGLVILSAWYDPPAITVGPEYHAMHREIWERLRVPSRPQLVSIDAGPVYCLDEAEEKLEDHLASCRFEIVEGDAEGEWLAIDRDEVPGTILAELTQIEHEIHMYERCVLMRFDQSTAAAYQLLHVFLHEIGHHRNLDEEEAENWANRCADVMWDDALALLGR